MISPYVYPCFGLVAKEPVPTDHIVRSVAEITGVSYELIMARKCRKEQVVSARYLAWKYVKIQFPAISLSEIGRLFGGFHHSTILVSAASLEAQINDSDKVKMWDEKIGNRLKRLSVELMIENSKDE